MLPSVMPLGAEPSTVSGASELLLRWQELRQQGRRLPAEELCADCPELVEGLRQQIRALESMERLLGVGAEAVPPGGAEQGPADRFRVPGYELLRVLDRGGMGVVYQARQVRLNRLVAVKMILAGAHAGPQQLARFRVEAEAVARLQHPNIVQIYEVGECRADGAGSALPYFSMEYVEGGSLADQLARAPLPARQAAQLIETLARAIHCAHQRGIVHRDLKPANVLLAACGLADSKQPGAKPQAADVIPKIADFGLAKRLPGEPGASAPGGPTQTGAILGTPGYMAPEQADGRARDAGPAVDVYALGAILYETLTGRPPFRGETPLDTLEQVRSVEPVPPRRLQPKVPRDLETICLKCLRKEPQQRYASAEALADDLGRFLAGEPIEARPMSAWEQGTRWARHRPALAALILVSTLAAVSLLAGGVWFAARLRGERDHAQHQQRLAEERQAEAQRERDEADRQRDRAEGILQLACRALDDHTWSMISAKEEMRRDPVPGGILYNLAGVLAQASASTRHDAALAPDDRRRLADRYAARAVQLLGHSRAAGYFALANNVEKLKTDPNLDPLRTRPEFQELLGKLDTTPAAADPPSSEPRP